MRDEASGDIGGRYRRLRAGMATARYSPAFLGLMDFSGDFGSTDESTLGLSLCSQYHELEQRYQDKVITREVYKTELTLLITTAP